MPLRVNSTKPIVMLSWMQVSAMELKNSTRSSLPASPPLKMRHAALSLAFTLAYPRKIMRPVRQQVGATLPHQIMKSSLRQITTT